MVVVFVLTPNQTEELVECELGLNGTKTIDK